jgi:DNA-binding NarL/FixJ family response regulator
MAGSLRRPAALSAHRKLGLVATIRRTWTAKRADVYGPRFTATLLIDELMPDGLAATLGVIAANRNALSAGTEIMEQRSRPEALVGGMGMHLTTREREVLQRLAEGGDTRTIAYAMHYSERTVKYVVHATLTKLNCRTRAQAVGLAVKYGLI